MKSCLRFSIVLFVVWWDTDDRQIEVDSQTDRHEEKKEMKKRGMMMMMMMMKKKRRR